MARMLGKMRPSWCWTCNRPPRIDCPDHGKTTREAKVRERAEVRKMVRNMEGDPKLVLGSDC